MAYLGNIGRSREIRLLHSEALRRHNGDRTVLSKSDRETHQVC